MLTVVGDPVKLAALTLASTALASLVISFPLNISLSILPSTPDNFPFIWFKFLASKVTVN